MLRNRLLVALFVAVVAGVGGLSLLLPDSALAYGKADGPVAQIEFSGNCTSPTPGVCDEVGGTGGIWLWIELDAGGTGDVSGAGCGHTIGGGGAGAGSIKGEVSWVSVTTNDPFGQGAEFFGTFDPNGQYYKVTIPDGETFLFPQTVGHYAQRFGPGFQLQLQVAP